MSAWIMEALSQAIETLNEVGKFQTASDLRRLIDVADLESLDILRSAAADHLVGVISGAKSYSELRAALSALCHTFRLSHATVHLVSEKSGITYDSKVITTYPDSWVDEYFERNYFDIDPVVEACEQRKEGFNWSSLNKSDALTDQFLAAANAAGIGPSGYTFIVEAEEGDRIALSVVSERSEEEFLEQLLEIESDLAHVAHFVSRSFASAAARGRPSTANLTPDHLRLLRAASAGADDRELAKIPFAFGSAKTVEKSICELFRTKTLLEAAVLAARLGLLDETPLFRNEVFTNGRDRKLAQRHTLDNVTSISRRVLQAQSAS